MSIQSRILNVVLSVSLALSCFTTSALAEALRDDGIDQETASATEEYEAMPDVDPAGDSELTGDEDAATPVPEADASDAGEEVAFPDTQGEVGYELIDSPDSEPSDAPKAEPDEQSQAIEAPQDQPDEQDASEQSVEATAQGSGAVKLNATELTLYAVAEKEQDFVSLPSDKQETFKLEVTGGSNPRFSVTEGDTVDVSQDGVVSVRYTTYYWQGNFGTTWEPEDMTGVTVERSFTAGESAITVYTDEGNATVRVNVVDYGQECFDQALDAYIVENVTSGMATYDKVKVAAQYAASFDYDYRYSSARSMYYHGGGDCWASTDMIIKLCTKMGLNAWSRNGNRDSGAGSGHVNAIVEGGNDVYYIAEAGFNVSSPRLYYVEERNTLWSYTVTDGDAHEIELYQYDGKEWPSHVAIPASIGDYTVTGLGYACLGGGDFSSVDIPETVRSIGSFCFADCENLDEFEIPAGVSYVGDSAFSQCPGLNLTVAADNEWYCAEGGALYNKDKTVLVAANCVSSISIPKTVVEIGTGAFYYNEQIREVDVPSSVTTIGDFAFGRTGITSYRFRPRQAPTLGKAALDGLSSSCTIKIPAGATGYDEEPWTAATIEYFAFADAEINLDAYSFTYDGTEKKPRVTSVVLEDVELVEGRDYTVSYEGDVVNAGSPSVVVKGSGTFAGEYDACVSYRIEPRSLAGASIDAIPAQTYTGEKITPKETLTFEGKVLRSGIDYKVVYAANTDAGTATVTVTGTGNYRGKVSTTFQIKPLDLANAVISPIPDQPYCESALTPALTVKVGGVTLISGKDYRVTYADNVKIGTAKVTLEGLGNAVGSATTSFNIVEPTISLATVSPIPAQDYTGKPLTPSVTVKIGSKTLVAGTDYEVSYADNIDAGTAKVTIVGAGSYDGETSATFTIEPMSISDVRLSGLSAETYTGSAIKPVPIVKVGSTALVKGVDYTLYYQDNVGVGTATVIVEGKGNYSGKTTGSFTIKPKELVAENLVSVSVTKVDGWPSPSLTVKDGGTTLEEGVDYYLSSYSVSVSDGGTTGDATVTVSGIGNYTGKVTKDFSFGKTQSITASNKTVEVGKTVSLGAKTSGDGKLTYKSSDTSVATVSAKGVVTGKKSGSCKVTITAAETTGYKKATRTVTITVLAKGEKPGTWKQSSGKWWFQYTNGTYPMSQIATIQGAKYYFDASGYMATGWKQVGGKWYFFESSGAMATNKWVQSGSRWCYLKADGTMATGWLTLGSTTYYMDASGYMVTGWKQVSGKWYYFESSGAMARNKWVQSGSRWCYLKADGTMATGWLSLSGKTYWMDGSGYMVTGWKQISGKYYYFESSGAMAKSKWVGNYWLGSDGVMATEAWVDGGRYYVGKDGAWVKGMTR